MSYEERKNRFLAEIIRYKGIAARLNDYLADYPELSCQEHESSKRIVELLRAEGYETEYPFAGYETGFRAVYGRNGHLHKAAILLEYDALPALGHGCGHCLSAAISLLAGLGLKNLQDELNADIHLIGTPGEELDGAKCGMTDRGIFDDYDMAIMVHLNNSSLAVPKLQAMAPFVYHFRGKASHASAAPWDGVNAFNGAQLTFHAIDMLRQHIKPGCQMHGIITKSGEAANIVPEKATAELYARALNREDLHQLVSLMDDCARGAAVATQTTWEKVEVAPYYNLRPNPAGEAALNQVFEELHIKQNGNPDSIFGSSDMGNVSFACPAFHPLLQLADQNVSLHSRQFAAAVKSPRAYECLEDGAKIIGFLILKIFGSASLLAEIKKDFKEGEL